MPFEYLEYTLNNSVKNWQSTWFYIINKLPGLPKFSWEALTPRECWHEKLELDVLLNISPLIADIKRVKESEVTMSTFIKTFLQCRIQPPKARNGYMSEYIGEEDSNRLVRAPLDE